jgi:predicted metalloprotease
MKWTPGGESSNIEDRRGSSGGFGIGGRGMGIGGTAVLLILSLVFGHNFFNDASNAAVGDTTSASAANGAIQETPEEHKQVQFVSYVLDDIQSTWAKLLPSEGVQYRDTKLVLFRNGTNSGCGMAQTAMGPFYCPVDKKVYIDLGFYDELSKRFGASGDFAEAYVLAHEFGHHVQDLLGTEARVRQLEESRPNQANALSVRFELQADCFAGIWANTTDQRKLLEPGDVQEAMNAAASVGDDRIQRQTEGSVHPESFTHGTAEQRAAWFKRGFEGGRVESCDTFAGGI